MGTPKPLHLPGVLRAGLRENALFKRRGPAHAGVLHLRSVPAGLEDILTLRLQRPSLLLKKPETTHVVGRSAPAERVAEQLAVHE